jgi:hypothetical protein
MTVYTGNTPSRTNRIQKITTSPKLLQIRKGVGRKRLLFSEIKTSESDDGVSAEGLVSGTNWRLTEYAKEHNLEASAVDDVSLADITRRAVNSCSCCQEAIPGNELRYVRITVQIPSVGAEAEKCISGSICAKCFDSGATVEALAAEPTLDAIDAKADDWQNARSAEHELRTRNR